ncbi:MAG: ABC transporter ATP-binding protein [Clostridia bacterium]|nr:ABC transporter ATP-binding protein [Clostridia bacterium]
MKEKRLLKKAEAGVGVIRETLTEWRMLGPYIKKNRYGIIAYIVIGIVGIALGLSINVAGKHLIDAVINRNRDIIIPVISVVIGLGLARIAFSAVSSRVEAHINTSVVNRVRADIFSSILSTKWLSFSDFHSGELINRIEGDVNTAASGIVNFIPNVVTRSAQFIGILAIILYYDPVMALLSLGSAPILVLSSRMMARTMKKYNKLSREMNGKILSFNEETFQNITVVKAFDLAVIYCKNLGTLLSAHRRYQLDYNKFMIIMKTVMSLIGMAVAYGCYGWGVWQLWNGNITYGTMTLFLRLSGQLTTSFSQLVSLVPNAISIGTSAGRLKEIFELPHEDQSRKPEAEAIFAKAGKSSLSIKAENVSFKYPAAPSYAFRNVDFYAGSGEKIAFVGESGGGKTTTLRLLLGLISPETGTIRLSSDQGSIDISESTRCFFSYVTQGNEIFSGTIESNMRSVVPGATDEDIASALKTADAWGFVSGLPDGIYSEIGERGANLSQGQIQRLNIARSILRSAPVLLMDEATSALDPETERRVLENLMKADPGRICVITTHRESILPYCDRVYRIHDGKCELQS